jgi:hypothetical protein
MSKAKAGRRCLPARIKINAVSIVGGVKKHLFSVITLASVTDVLIAMQAFKTFVPVVKTQGKTKSRRRITVDFPWSEDQ